MKFKNMIIYSTIFLLLGFLIPAINSSPLCFPLENPPASFNGIFNDFGNDTDGNGLYNLYTVEIGIKVNVSDNYRITGRFEDSEGKLLFAETTSNLSIGNQTVTINFGENTTYTIHRYRVNGPASIDFKIYNDTEVCPIDEYYDFTTYAYNYTEYDMHKNGGFTDIFKDYVIDIDGDGLYDSLVINVGVNIITPGNYSISASLYDNTMESITNTRNTTYLNAGNHSILLVFDGLVIFRNRVDGPYRLRYLGLELSGEASIDFILDAYNTSAYGYRNFRRPSAIFNGIFSFFRNDSDNNGLYENLSVKVGIEVTTAGQYLIVGDLYDNNESDITDDKNSSYLDIGNQYIILNFNISDAFQKDNNGTYVLKYLTLFGDNGIDIFHDVNITFQYKEDNKSEIVSKGVPGFEIILIICAIALVLFWQRRRIWGQQE